MEAFRIVATLYLAIGFFLPSQAAYEVASIHDFKTVEVMPNPGLVKAGDGNYYGTTKNGGDWNRGSIFRVTPAGEITTIHSFRSELPVGNLTLGNDGVLYGATGDSHGGSAGEIFGITTSGIFSEYYPLDRSATGSYFQPLVKAADGQLYGTALDGGTGFCGTVFRFSPSAPTKFTTIHAFTHSGSLGQAPGPLTAGSDGLLYGATATGGGSGGGAIFKMTTGGQATLIGGMSAAGIGIPKGRLALDFLGGIYGSASVKNSGLADLVFKMSSSGVVSTVRSLSGFHDPVDMITTSTGKIIGALPYGSTPGISQGQIFQYDPSTGIYSILKEFTDGSVLPLSVTPTDSATFLGVGAARQNVSGEVIKGLIFSLEANGTHKVIANFPFETNGSTPMGSLVEGPDGSLYGTTALGGEQNGGTLFRIAPDGTFSLLTSFTRETGTFPSGPLLLGPDGSLYGTTQSYGPKSAGGAASHGTVFRFEPGMGLSVLTAFNGSDGAGMPVGITKGADGDFYGVTQGEATNDGGAFFKVTAGGTFTKLADFAALGSVKPSSPLLLGSDGNFYGATLGNGNNEWGAIYRVTPAGSFSLLAVLDGKRDAVNDSVVNSASGVGVFGALLQTEQGDLIGSATAGGANGFGTIFKVSLSGGLSVVYDCDLAVAGPRSGLTRGQDGWYYGQSSGGSFFKMSQSGEMNRLLILKPELAGAGSERNPLLQTANGTWYGTRYRGGPYDDGVVFRLETVPDPEPTPTPGPTATPEPTSTPDLTMPEPPISLPEIPSVRKIEGQRNGRIETDASRITLRGTLDDSNVYVEYCVGEGRYKRAEGGAKWAIKTSLNEGRNIMYIRTVDSTTGLKSKRLRVVLVRK